MPSNLNEHITYTNKEWSEQDYYVNVLNYIKSKNIKNMIDAGGCTGEVTKIFFKNIESLKKAYIFEANKNNAEFIKNNLANYPIEIINKCLYYGKSEISIGLNYGDDNVGGYSVNYGDKNIIENNIPTITLESIYDDIDFIKIDIEGAEKNVIVNSKKIKEITYLEIEFHEDLEEETSWKNFINQYLFTHKIVTHNNNHVLLEIK